MLVALWVAFARGPATGDRLLRYAAACTCAFIVFGKVLSPQYLIWLAAARPARPRPPRPRRDCAADRSRSILTQVWFPQRYFAYALEFRNAGVVLVRDLVLVALLAVLAWPRRLARAG